MRVAPDRTGDIALDPVDRRIVAATQAGLPLTARPYHAVAQDLGLPAAEVMRRITRMLETGAIRRIGAVPNHYALGWTANGMSVWDLADAEAGGAVLACERRVRALTQRLSNIHLGHVMQFPPIRSRRKRALRHRLAQAKGFPQQRQRLHQHLPLSLHQ